MTFQDFLMNSPSGGLMIKVGDGTPIGGLPPWIASDTVNGGLMFKVNGAGYTPPDGMLQTTAALSSSLQVVKDNLGNSSTLKLGTTSTELSSNLTLNFGGYSMLIQNGSDSRIDARSSTYFFLMGGGVTTLFQSGNISNGQYTANATLDIKGQGGNILTLRDSSGVEKVKIENTGQLIIDPTYGLQFGTGSSVISAPSNGNLTLLDNAGTSFGRLQLGGTTASFPAIKRSGAAIEFRAADNSGYCDITANDIFVGSQYRNIGLSSGTCIRYANDELRASITGNSGVFKIYNPAVDANVFWMEATGSLSINKGSAAVASAILQADSTTKGFLMPRQTTAQINAIATPANGLQVYNTDLAQPCFYDGAGWRKVSHSAM